ncbi:MAG: FAD-dependent oxidoreductase [Alphaproteobacteria bacterium]|nr:FAD-dependent oxidoreductase [Alphaproteobacteria bacterium]
MRIIIIGAGIAGVTAAWELQKDGHEVILLEAAAQIASGATYANGGQIAVADSAPWSRAGLAWEVLKHITDRHVPYRLQVRASFTQWRWLFNFWRNCNDKAHRRGASRNRLLAQYSQTCLQATRANLGDELAYCGQQTGNLRLVATAEQEAAEREALIQERGAQTSTQAGAQTSTQAGAQTSTQAGAQKSAHADTEAGTQTSSSVWLTADELVSQEPTLAEAVAAGLVRGAIWSCGDESGDAAQFTRALTKAFTRLGGALRLNCAVQGFVLSGRAATPPTMPQSVQAVQTNQGDLEADAVILAAGVASSQLARQLGLYVPILPVKGYSVTVPIHNEALAPQASLTDINHRLVITRLGRFLRVAGYAEIGTDTQIDRKRIEAMIDYMKCFFPQAGDYSKPENWVGFRPLTPDSAPLIGRMQAYDNLWFHTGHGTLGWTLAHGTARLLADIMSGTPPKLDTTPFAPDRRFIS